MSTLIEVLEERGFIDAITSEEVKTLLKTPQKIYAGFDPTSSGLHLGSFVPIMGLAWFQRYGHTPVVLVGGATAMIGDPSGKSQERNLLTREIIEENVVGIRRDLETILSASNPSCAPLMVNNYDWFKEFTFLDFLRDIGKHFRLGPMLGKDSVRSRLQSEEGISFTEFSYQLLQGYDFLHLFDHHRVKIQLGGSDQWGNITAGCDLVRKLRGETVFGITFPLLTRSDGKKFGKSEEGAIWLSSDKLSSYEFYQYLIRIPDADVIRMMKLLTFMEMHEIRKIERHMTDLDYQPNSAQKRLAAEVTRLVHGESGLQSALQVTAAAAPGAAAILDAAVLEQLAADMPSVTLSRSQVVGVKLLDLFVLTGLSSSKSEARRLMQNGGTYLNNEKIATETFQLTESHLIENKVALLAAGKKHKMLIRVE